MLRPDGRVLSEASCRFDNLEDYEEHVTRDRFMPYGIATLLSTITRHEREGKINVRILTPRSTRFSITLIADCPSFRCGHAIRSR